MTQRANISDFSSKVTDYLDAVRNGDEVILADQSGPFAKVVPLPSHKNRTVLGEGRGTVQILGPLDEPLIPEEDWEMLR